MVIPKPGYAGEVRLWEGNAKSIKQPGAVQMTAAKEALLVECSNTTSITVTRAELGKCTVRQIGT